MQGKYSQLRAMLAITRGSLKAILRSPSSIAFGIGFPMIFILVFGFIGGNGGISLDVALKKNADTANPVYFAIKSIPGLHFSTASDSVVHEQLGKGQITAVIDIQKNTSANPAYIVKLTSSEAVNERDLQVLQSLLNGIVSGINERIYSNTPSIAAIEKDVQTIPGREYKEIDFILPGQLGFSLLAAGVFAVAFLFYNLRQQLVLKRFFATPIRRSYIVIGEALARVVYQLFTAIIIIAVGNIVFHFTLVNGFITFIQMMILSFIGLVVFMGYGFVVSSLAKNESTIPPFANLFTFPQLLLSGTFFPIEVFPKWLQQFCNLLPLTHFNNAMRNISFEGLDIFSCWKDIGALLIWGVLLYGLAIKVFKWD